MHKLAVGLFGGDDNNYWNAGLLTEHSLELSPYSGMWTENGSGSSLPPLELRGVYGIILLL